MGCKVTKNNTTSIQYIERIFVWWRGSRISGEKLLILKKGGGPLNAVFHMGGWQQKNLKSRSRDPLMTPVLVSATVSAQLYI